MQANNVVLLRGRVTSEPRLRELPSGSAIVNLDVTTVVDDVSISVPVVVDRDTVDCGAGDDVVIAGHVRRRFFRAGGATQSRTEVVAVQLVRAGRARAVEKLVERVAATLGDPG